MARRKRDFAKEYYSRITRGTQRGLTRSQARGHPGPGERLVSQPTKPSSYSRQLEAGFKAIREGKPLAAAAREIHVSSERLRRYLREQGIAERRGRRWVALDDNRPRRMLMYSNGEARTVTVDRPAASDIGTYMSAASHFLNTNLPIFLQPFEDLGVIDIRGIYHPFETDPNTLYRLAHSGDETFEQVYRIIL
jgi:hypothetical protein